MDEPTVTELVPLACRGVTMVTQIADKHVTHEVWVGASPMAGDRSEARKAWSRVVSFGTTAAFRAGGPMFRLAAMAQERVARAYVEAAKGLQ